MINILYAYERDMPTVSIMRKDAELFYGDDASTRYLNILEIRPNDIDWADCVVFIRPDNVLSFQLAKKAHTSGCYVVAFYDDDLLHLPRSIPSMPWRRRYIRRIIQEADLLQSSSNRICRDYLKEFGKKKWYVSDTPIYGEDIAKIPAKKHGDGETIKLVYAAGRDHVGTFNDFIKPIIPQLMKKYGNRISLTTVGVNPDLKEYSEGPMKIEHKEGMPLEEYRRFMRKEAFDIGLAPLHDNEFNQKKYFNKYLEYTLVGTVGIYSNCEPYTFVVVDEENGFLANNSADDWCQAICKAIERSDLRDKCLNAAINQLKTRFSAPAQSRRFREDNPDFFTKKRKKNDCGSLLWIKTRYVVSHVADIVYLVWFYFRKDGVKGVLHKVQERINL